MFHIQENYLLSYFFKILFHCLIIKTPKFVKSTEWNYVLKSIELELLMFQRDGPWENWNDLIVPQLMHWSVPWGSEAHWLLLIWGKPHKNAIPMEYVVFWGIEKRSLCRWNVTANSDKFYANYQVWHALVEPGYTQSLHHHPIEQSSDHKWLMAGTEQNLSSWIILWMCKTLTWGLILLSQTNNNRAINRRSSVPARRDVRFWLKFHNPYVSDPYS